MKNLYRKVLTALLILQALVLVRPLSVRAEETTCPPPVEVAIDVKPGDAVDKINLASRGLLPVAVFGASDFDASLFTPMMAHLHDASAPMGCSGAEAVRWTYTDVNRDGRVDLVFFFQVQDLTLTKSTTAVTLMAHSTDEVHIMGMDAMIVKP